MPGIGTTMTVDVPTQPTKNGNVTPNANSTQPRRCKSRQVSSRYMLPTASSMAASTSSRSASPIRRGRKSTDSNESNSRSASTERRRPNSPKEQKSEPIFQAVTNHTSSRPKAATSALWPSASSTNTALSRSGDSAKSSKTTDSTNSLATKENAHAHAVGHGHGNNHVRVSVRSKSVESDVFTTNRHSSGYGRSSSSLHIRKKSSDNNSSESASQGRLSVDLDLRPKDSGDDVFSNSSEGACSTPTRENCSNPISGGENDSNSTDEGKKVKRMIRGSYVPARFLQDTLSRLRRLSDAGNISSSMKLNSHLRRASAAECSVSVPVIVRSKSNLAANGTPNPNPNPNPRTSAATAARSNGNGSSKMTNMLNFGVEFFKGKRGVIASSAAQEETMHQLRLMHNRWLQWRFVNARAQTSSEIQKNAAESSLYNVWLKTAQLRASVAMKRIQYDRLRYEQKIRSVIAAHASLLNQWEDIEEDHMVSVAEAKDCLDSATVRVPLVAGAKADVYEVTQVLGYSTQVMQGIQVSMNRFWQQADNVGSLLPELAEIVTQERALLQQTSEMLSILSSLEEEERSLKAHLIQMHRQVRQATATT